jgi:hypothetical protein
MSRNDRSSKFRYFFKWLEYKSRDTLDKMIKSGFVKDRYSFIHSSDAHYLWDILERETSIDTESLSCYDIIKGFM